MPNPSEKFTCSMATEVPEEAALGGLARPGTTCCPVGGALGPVPLGVHDSMVQVEGVARTQVYRLAALGEPHFAGYDERVHCEVVTMRGNVYAGVPDPREDLVAAATSRRSGEGAEIRNALGRSTHIH
jgi:hypothetical protein